MVERAVFCTENRVFLRDLSLEQVAGIVIQSRVGHYATAKFKNVSLVPGKKTDVQIEVEGCADSNSADAEVKGAASKDDAESPELVWSQAGK